MLFTSWVRWFVTGIPGLPGLRPGKPAGPPSSRLDSRDPVDLPVHADSEGRDLRRVQSLQFLFPLRPVQHADQGPVGPDQEDRGDAAGEIVVQHGFRKDPTPGTLFLFKDFHVRLRPEENLELPARRLQGQGVASVGKVLPLRHLGPEKGPEEREGFLEPAPGQVGGKIVQVVSFLEVLGEAEIDRVHLVEEHGLAEGPEGGLRGPPVQGNQLGFGIAPHPVGQVAASPQKGEGKQKGEEAEGCSDGVTQSDLLPGRLRAGGKPRGSFPWRGMRPRHRIRTFLLTRWGGRMKRQRKTMGLSVKGALERGLPALLILAGGAGLLCGCGGRVSPKPAGPARAGGGTPASKPSKAGSPWFGEVLFDAGKVDEGTLVKHSFPFLNPDALPRKILAVQKDCACAEVKILFGGKAYPGVNPMAPPLVIPPGGRGKVEIALDTTAVDGIKTAGVSVQVDSPGLPWMHLTLKALSRIYFWADPRSVALGEMEGTEKRDFSFRVYSKRVKHWKITKVDAP
ncbi:MAG TPA: DUF1573 domain-containing protein, partial [Planctomycetes bacterium]|nr:DUF1573 domain-containing protein [Planctomycetota bacterium]